MIVMKFGGSSLRDGAGVRAAGGIIQDRLGRRPVVVVSAHGDTTDLLESLARADGAVPVGLREVRALHDAILAALGLPADLLDDLFGELKRALAPGSAGAPDERRDLVMSFGERFSARVVAAHLRTRGVDATAHAASDLGLVTESRSGGACPLPGTERALAEALRGLQGLPVVTGFIARDGEGRTTLLGRNGSDETAALLACAAGAEELQFWTDVDGVMSADPRRSSGARLLPRLTFAQAEDLAQRGAAALHPRALERVRAAGIPVRVLNTAHPEGQGTLIGG